MVRKFIRACLIAATLIGTTAVAQPHDKASWRT